MNSEDVLQIINGLLKDTSQSDLAKQFGVSPQFLSDVLHGRRKIGDKIPEALGLTPRVEYAKAKGKK